MAQIASGAACKRGIQMAVAAALISVAAHGHAQSFWKRSYGPEQNIVTNLDNAKNRFNTLSGDAPNDPKKLTDYVQSGITMSDLACYAWLDTLGKSERDSSFFKNIFNIVGNLIIGVAGINGANSDSLARGALGLSATNATFETFQNEILLGSIPDIEDKLREGRNISTAYFLANMPTQFDQAHRGLIEYHRTCSSNAIKSLLKTALSKVKYAAPDTTLAGPIAQAESDLVAAGLYKLMFNNGEEAPSDETLYRLWATRMAYPNPKAGLIEDMRKDPAVGVVGNAFDKKKDQFALSLDRIAALRGYKKRLDKELEKESAEKTAAAEREVADAKKALESKEKVAEQNAAAAVAAAPTAQKQDMQNISNLLRNAVKPDLLLGTSRNKFGEIKSMIEKQVTNGQQAEIKTLSADVNEMEQLREKLEKAETILKAQRLTQKSSSTPASFSAVIAP